MNKISKLLTGLFLVMAIGFMGSCKKNFDNPPGNSDPAIVANKTIAQLKALHTVPGAMDVITDDIIISGVVVANDKSGNLYKQLFIQDESGAIQLSLDAASLFGNYPVGRRVFVHCKGLCLSDYHNTMLMGIKTTIAGVTSVNGIPVTMLGNYIVGGSLNNPVVPKVVTAGSLTSNMQDPNMGALIQLDDYEFTGADTSFTYSDTSYYKNTTNHSIAPCSGAPIFVRTSGFSNFAGIRIPKGHGSIISIYTVYNSDKQLLVRDTSDVKFYGPRCGAPPLGSVVYIDENFETQTYVVSTPQTYSPIAITGWQNTPELGTRTYSARQFSGSKYAYLSGFGAGAVTKTWLVTKAINRTTATTTLTFDTKQDFLLTVAPGGTNVASALKILTSTNYTGTGNPFAAGVTWTDITAQAALSPGSTTGNFPSSYTPSGNINLNGTGVIYVAFRYEGDDPAGTTSDKTSAWEIDNIRVLGL